MSPEELVSKIAEMIEDWGGATYSDDHYPSEPYRDTNAEEMARLIIETVRFAYPSPMRLPAAPSQA